MAIAAGGGPGACGPGLPPPGRDLVRGARRLGSGVLGILANEKGWDPVPYQRRQAARLAGDPIYPPDLYLPQRYVLLDEPPEVSAREDALAAVLRLLDTAQARFVLVMADFGHGKSFLLRRLALRLPAAVPSLIPMLVELRGLKLGDPSDLDLDRLLDAHLRRVEEDGVPAGALRTMLERGRLVLLLDGFDELVQRLTFDEAAEYLRIILDSVRGAAKVVLTSRIAHFASDDQWRDVLGQWAQGHRVSRQLRLEPFDDAQIENFLRHRFRVRPAAGDVSPSAGSAGTAAVEDSVAARLGLIREVPNLAELSRNPRMLSFIAKLTRAELLALRADDGTITSARLYRALVRHWLTVEVRRRHPTRGSTSGLTVPQLSEVVTAVAIRIWTDADGAAGEIDLAGLTEIVRGAVTDPDGSRVTAEQAAFQVGSGSLLVRGDNDRFSFVHASVPEYLVAARVAEDLGDTGDSPLLGLGAMSSLMVQFLREEVGEPVVAGWVETVRRGGPPADQAEPAVEAAWGNAAAVAVHLALPPLPSHVPSPAPSAPSAQPAPSAPPAPWASVLPPSTPGGLPASRAADIQASVWSDEFLTLDEVDALVEAFSDLEQARLVVLEAGLAKGRQPAVPATLRVFWAEVVADLNAGAVRGGRGRLRTVAARERPGHPPFLRWAQGPPREEPR
ncbi:effector-associated domain EAD1-containing protein [Frankia sp. AiPs1]|uniref:NACHT domain-containing protein n=1 Tax=Frankia sp. AiPs1 TaxID=573493 RepID=UPI0020434B93|nr:effector-associated domain EAD1-containing protein [Frankia sp. AiPs1]MCM3923525.1 effector-associated domain EAD1-containing protein [Frankia sp. AiPs1]